MRPIDADLLSEEIASLQVFVIGLRAGKGVLRKYAEEYRNSVLRIIDEQPTIAAALNVNAKEVVHCQDCAITHNKYTGCPKLNGLITPPDFFCGYGEREKKMESKEAREWELQDKSEKPVKCETTTERAGGETAACIPAKRYVKILGELTMDDLRKECPMRHENGNCTVIGGFCTAVNDPICLGLHNAYELGCYNAALRLKQEPKFYEHAPVKQYDGLKQKYLVIKADTGELVKNCFVLRPDRDPAAVTALRAYAEATDNEALVTDIINWVGVDDNA